MAETFFYKIEGQGSTTSGASNDCESSVKKLMGKLMAACVSSQLDVHHALFSVELRAQEGIIPEGCDSVLSAESKKSWLDLASKKERLDKKKADGVKYNEQYHIERFYELSEEQVDAVRGKKRTPAGYIGKKDDFSLKSLDDLR